jgi:hypothetical protein
MNSIIMLMELVGNWSCERGDIRIFLCYMDSIIFLMEFIGK